MIPSPPIHQSLRLTHSLRGHWGLYSQDHKTRKSVIFSHSVISLNHLLQNSKNTSDIFLTFRRHVKLFLPQNIMQNF